MWLKRLQKRLHISVGGFDEVPERLGVDVAPGPQFDVSHELAAALQQPRWIGEDGAAVEPHVHVSRERIHVAERGIAHTGRRLLVMQQLADVVPAPAHD